VFVVLINQCSKAFPTVTLLDWSSRCEKECVQF